MCFIVAHHTARVYMCGRVIGWLVGWLVGWSPRGSVFVCPRARGVSAGRGLVAGRLVSAR